MKSFTKVESWTIEELIDCFSNSPIHKKKIIIPPFQRNLVWKYDQKKLLIDSIKMGMPIGAILLYNAGANDEINTFHLIDGLQRTTTIREYIENPIQFFEINNINEKFIKDLVSFLKNKGINVDDENIGKIVLEWIKNLKGFSETDNFSSYNLANFIDEKFNEILEKKDLKELSNNIIPQYLEEIKKESDITKKEIPVIIYSGDKSNLPTIFERLNSKGTQLSKYQIYAATWISYGSFKINNIEIIDKIKDKYESLIDDGLEIDNYDPENFYQSEFNFFEYFFGLGKFLSEKFPLLFNGSNEKDQTESIGFNLACICAGHNLKYMHNLPEKFKLVDINKFEHALIDVVGLTNDILKPYIGIKANSKKRIKQVCHSELQIVSIVGKLFREKYDEKFEIKNTWKIKKKDLIRNIPYHYLYDIIRNYWSGTGDAKANELAQSERYEKSISRDSWESVLNDWYSQEREKKEKSRVKISDIAITFLKYIYTHIFTTHDELSQTYEIEHIIPINRVKNILNEGLPMSTISNLCLLPNNINNEKKDKTIYEYFKQKVQSGDIDETWANKKISEIENKFTFTKEDDLKFLNNLNASNLEEYYKFLDDRFEKLKEMFYKKNEIL